MTQTTVSPWCELCVESIQEGCFGCNIDTPPTADPITVTYAADATTPARLMFLAAAAFGGANAAERWALGAFFVEALRSYGVDVAEFVELLECAAAEVAAD